jgi:ABC-type multidrug transport system ATPase subunit
MKSAETTPLRAPSLHHREIVACFADVSRNFDTPAFTRALSNVSFEVYRSEVLGLLGPSGSGKSTALRLLAGCLRASQGQVRVFGQGPWRRAVRRRVGFLAQDAGQGGPRFFHELISFLQELFLFPLTSPKLQPRRPASVTQRRAELSHLLLNNPDLLLLDDPFCGLDHGGCEEIKEIISTLAQKGKTVILSSDSLAYTKDVCDRICLLCGGWLRAVGTFEEVLAGPDVLSSIAPLLPQPTAEHVLRVISQDLAGATAHPVELSPQPETQSSSLTSPVLFPSPDRVLDGLVKQSQESAPTNQSGKPAAAIDHELLSALSKPAARIPPTDPERQA